MATVDILRPTSSSVIGGAWNINGGSASIQAALADTPDATSIQDAFGVGGNHVQLGFSGWTLPANAQIKSVTPRIRANTGAVSMGISFALFDGSSTGPGSSIPNNASIATYTGQALATTPSGAAWTQANVNAIMVRCYAPDAGAGSVIVAVYLDVAYNLPPSATGTALGTLTNTQFPNFAWTYSDPEGDIQERFRVKVFTSAQYGAGGFDPNTATPLIDSGIVVSSATSWQVPTGSPLTNGTYRAFIFVADAGSGGRFNVVTSAGPYSSVTISVTAPAVPTITATADPTNSRITLSLRDPSEATSGYLPGAKAEVQRSDDGGTTWAKLTRLYSSGTVSDLSTYTFTNTSTIITAYDYEAPRNRSIQYRIRSVVSLSGGGTAASAWSAAATVANNIPTTEYQWRLKVPYNPTLNWMFDARGPEFTRKSSEEASFYNPIGRTRSVKVTDVIHGDEFSLTIMCFVQAAADAFVAIRATQQTILIQAPDGRQWYVGFTNDVNAADWFVANPFYREYSAGFEEQDAPI